MHYIEDITQWREDMNFIFEWQNNIFTNERSEWVKYCSCHEITEIRSSINSCLRSWKINHSVPDIVFMNFTSGIFSSKSTHVYIIRPLNIKTVAKQVYVVLYSQNHTAEIHGHFPYTSRPLWPVWTQVKVQ